MDDNVGLEKRPEKRSGNLSRRKLQLRSLMNALRTFQCAPTVMRTLRESQGAKDERMVKLTSGLPGGIGSHGAECGGITSPIMVLGLEYGGGVEDEEIPKVLILGQRYMDRFRRLNGGINCRELTIDWNDREAVKAKGSAASLRCLKVMCRAPGLLMDLIDEDAEGVSLDIDGETANAYKKLLKSFRDNKFHCTHSVLYELDDVIDVDEKLLRISWGFLGGTLLQGLTCGALTAGVLIIGSEFGEIENSYIRVLKLMTRFFTDGDITRDDLNKFNRAINISHKLALWFEDEFGSTKCNEILKIDFSTHEGVDKYLMGNGMNRCREITNNVARRVRKLLKEY